jgi:hypothetical protein
MKLLSLTVRERLGGDKGRTTVPWTSSTSSPRPVFRRHLARRWVWIHDRTRPAQPPSLDAGTIPETDLCAGARRSTRGHDRDERSTEEIEMTRHLRTLTVVPCAAVAFLVATAYGLGVIESVTVAAFATIGWSLVERFTRPSIVDGGDLDGARR